MSIVSKQAEPDKALRPGVSAPIRKDSACIVSLRIVLANTVVFGYMAQGFHWNVTGPDFPQLHELFGNIYEDAFDSIDPTAENIRKLGGEAPFMLDDFQRLSTIDTVSAPIDAPAMLRALLAAVDQLLRSVNDAFAIATDINEQGIADFLASRDDMLKKWAWQLRESIG